MICYVEVLNSIWALQGISSEESKRVVEKSIAFFLFLEESVFKL